MLYLTVREVCISFVDKLPQNIDASTKLHDSNIRNPEYNH